MIKDKTCLLCNRTHGEAWAYPVLVPGADNRRKFSKSSCVHKNCLSPEMLKWFMNNRLIRYGFLFLPSLAKFREVRNTRTVKSRIGEVGTKANEGTKAKWDEKENRKFYQSEKWKRIARSVRAAFGYVCVRCCGKEGGEVPVHHIDGNIRRNEIARLDPVTHLVVGNLVTLCNKCHRFVHQNVPEKKVWAYFRKVLGDFPRRMPNAPWSRDYTRRMTKAAVPASANAQPPEDSVGLELKPPSAGLTPAQEAPRQTHDRPEPGPAGDPEMEALVRGLETEAEEQGGEEGPQEEEIPEELLRELEEGPGSSEGSHSDDPADTEDNPPLEDQGRAAQERAG